MRRIAVRVLNAIFSHKRLTLFVLFLMIASPVLLVAGCYAVISPNARYVTSVADAPTMSVGIVLGAGVASNGKPYKELQARLDVAAAALAAGKVDRLIVSGDNRFLNYNEPQAMLAYLVQHKGVAIEKLQPDYAGRSTYESCERAIKVFGVQETIIFSARSHLPRAIYLCRHFGIEAYGVSSDVEANNSTRRELLARVKAVYNVWIRGEPTVLGDPIDLK